MYEYNTRGMDDPRFDGVFRSVISAAICPTTDALTGSSVIHLHLNRWSMLGHGSIGDLSSLTAYTSDDDDDLPQSEANSRFDLKDHGLLTKASAPSISTLHRWLHDHGVQASPKTAITAIEGAGWGMRASSNLYEHDISESVGEKRRCKLNTPLSMPHSKDEHPLASNVLPADP